MNNCLCKALCKQCINKTIVYMKFSSLEGIPESWRLEFLEKFSTNNFSLSDAEDNTSESLNRGGITDLHLLRTLLAIHKKSREPSFCEVMDSFVLLAYASLAASRTLLQKLLVCLNCRFRRFILLVQTKKVISMNYDSRKSSWKSWRWVRLDLILTMSDIYVNSNLNPLTKFTSSSRGTEFKDILPWNISQMTMKTVPISIRIVVSYVMKQDIPLWIWWKVNGNWDNNMIRISQWRERHCRANTSLRRNK